MVAAGFGTRPCSTWGPSGAFDDSGVTSSCLVAHEGRKYLYYTGWSLGVTVPFYLAAGLAVSEDGGETYRRVSAAPILARSDADPFLTASPWVLAEDGRLAHVVRVGLAAGGGRATWLRHYYDIRYAESTDGVRWRPTGRVCLDLRRRRASTRSPVPAWSRGGPLPDVVRVRGEAYRLGYAESKDGLDWEPSTRGPASSHRARAGIRRCCATRSYSTTRGRRYLLYNGNDYGRTGIGLAVLEPESAQRSPQPRKARKGFDVAVEVGVTGRRDLELVDGVDARRIRGHERLPERSRVPSGPRR